MPEIVDDPQYQQALAGIRGQLAGGLPPQASPDEREDFYDSLAEMMLTQKLADEAPQKKEKKGFNFFALIPGYAQGQAFRQQIEQRNEALKLQQQQLKGEAAARQLQLRKYLDDIRAKREGRQQRKMIGDALRLLQEGGLDPQAQGELQGQIGQGVAQLGDVGDILQFQEGQQEQAAQRAIAGLSSATPEAPEVPAGPSPAESPLAPPPVTAPTGRQPLAVRNNNPGNIKLGGATQRYVDAGLAVPAEAATDGGRFLKFATPQAGAQAMQELLTGPVYRDLTVDAALKKWSNRGYGASIAPAVDPAARIGDLSPQQLQYVQQRMAQVEAGSSGSQAPAPAAAGADAPALAQDRGRLQLLEGRLRTLDRRRAQLLPLAHTKAGKAAYDNVQQDYSQVVSEINTLRTRLYEQGGEKFQRELQKARETGLEGARMAAERTRLTEEAKTQAERSRTLDEVKKEDATLYRDKTTGEPVDPTLPYATVLDEAKPKGSVVVFTAKQREQWDKIEQVLPVVAELRDATEQVYGPGGIFENLTPEDRVTAAAKGGWARFTQSNPELALLGRLIESNVDVVRRALAGQVGTQTEQDAVRGTGAFARTKGIPDSQAVAYGLTNAFQTMIQRGQRAMLRNPQFTHPTLRPLERQGTKPPAAMSTEELLLELQRSVQ